MNTKDKNNKLIMLAKQLQTHTDYLHELFNKKHDYLSRFNQKVYDLEVMNTLTYIEKYRKEIYEIYMNMK